MTTRVGWIPCIGPPPPPGTPTYLPKRRRSSTGEGQGKGKISSSEEYSESTNENLSFKIPNVGPQEMMFKESKTPLKLVMDPRGQIQDLASLRQQGYNIEPGALSPEICLDLVRDLNATKGKGAELFAKRRKKSEKWVVDETTVKRSSIGGTTTDMISSSSSTLQRQTSIGAPSQLPPILPSYLDSSRVQHAQKLNEIQERFTLPRLRLVKSPWEAALETGSVDAAFQELKPLQPVGFPTTPAPIANEPTFSSTFDGYTSTTPQPAPPQPAFTPAGVSQSFSHEKDFLYKPKPPKGWSSTLPSQHSYVPPTPAYNYEPAVDTVEEQPPAARFSFKTLNNYNTAPRGWGQGVDYYRPVTFAPTRIG